MDLYSTRTDEIADEDIVDIGYHYPAIVRILESIEISGPDEVAEDFQAQYQAIAHYDNTSTVDVTDSEMLVRDDNSAFFGGSIIGPLKRPGLKTALSSLQDT